MVRVVLDTNILISGIFRRGNPYRILRMCLQNELRDLNDDTLPEHTKEQLPQWIREFRDYVLDNAQIVEIPQDLSIWFPE